MKGLPHGSASILDPDKAQAGKEIGQGRALEAAGEWTEIVLAELHQWLKERRAAGATHMTMEEFRAVAVNQPASHHAWGGLATIARQAGMIVPSGYVLSKSTKTHSHPVMRWMIANLDGGAA